MRFSRSPGSPLALALALAPGPALALALAPPPPSSGHVRAAPVASVWADEPLAETRTAAPRLRHIRSTLLCSGLVELRARGFFDAYIKVLDPAVAPVLLEAVAGTWLPLRICMAHFTACEAVVPSAVAFEIGGASGRRVQQSALSTLVRLATGAGASPWTVFANYGRLWSRIFDGGTVTIVKLGPKEATIDFSDVPIAQFSYFRNALRGTNEGALRLFAQSLYVRELSKFTTSTSVRYRVSWV